MMGLEPVCLLEKGPRSKVSGRTSRVKIVQFINKDRGPENLDTHLLMMFFDLEPETLDLRLVFYDSICF
jgi:hypothetical protein